MSDTKLEIAFGEYDRTRILADGIVKINGVDAVFHSHRIVTEVFDGMIRKRAFDVSELGMTYFLRTMDFEEPPFIAIPIFPNRSSRHSAIYINKANGIKAPGDLVGKTIGEFAVYGHDAGVWPKGILSDDYGVTPDQCRWIVGALDWPLKPVDFIPRPHPANVEVEQAPEGKDLGEMLEEGEIDALIAADIPKCVLEKSPKVARLFEDSPTVGARLLPAHEYFSHHAHHRCPQRTSLGTARNRAGSLPRLLRRQSCRPRAVQKRHDLQQYGNHDALVQQTCGRGSHPTGRRLVALWPDGEPQGRGHFLALSF